MDCWQLIKIFTNPLTVFNLNTQRNVTELVKTLIKLLQRRINSLVRVYCLSFSQHFLDTVKPILKVTCIKQSCLKRPLFQIPLKVNNGKLPVLSKPLSLATIFLLSHRCLLNKVECTLTLVLLNLDRSCLCKQCRPRSVGFWRSQLIWVYTVCH